MKSVNVLGVNLCNISEMELLHEFNEGLLMPVNVDMIMKFQRDKEFYIAYKTARYPICDSMIIKVMVKLLYGKKLSAIPGSSFFSNFYNYHKNNNEVRIFLLGAGPSVANTAMEKINSKIGRDIVVGAYSPSYGFEINEDECSKIVDMINESSATVLAIGVGAPKQEKWIAKYRDKLTNIKRYLAIGATIDFEAGRIRRAPSFVQNLGLEWFYRLMLEPKRLWRRYLVDDIPFFYIFFKQRCGLYKNPFDEQF